MPGYATHLLAIRPGTRDDARVALPVHGMRRRASADTLVRFTGPGRGDNAPFTCSPGVRGHAVLERFGGSRDNDVAPFRGRLPSHRR